jgi:hypothetical protein
LPAVTARPTLVRRPEDVTPAWLSEVLGAEVGGFDAQAVGTGQMADSVRFVLDAGEAAPASVVIKFAAANDTSRATGQVMRSYEIEVRFYLELAATVGIRTPACHYAAVDPATGWFTLVLEDLAPAAQGDQMAGCTVDQAALALEQAARLHAPRWGDPALLELEWFHRAQSADASGAIIGALFPGFVQRYEDRLSAEQLAMAERVVNGLPTLRAHDPGPLTVTHGDYRLDNMLFGTDEGGPPLAVVDWQTASAGAALADVSYFLGAGLQPGDRRASEEGLLREYHRALVAGGVEGYEWSTCWDDYRRYSFGGLLMAIGASMVVQRTDRGDDMFMTMATGHIAQAIDLGAEEFLG